MNTVVKKVTGTVIKKGATATPVDALKGVNMLLQAHKDYTMVREEEQTKREAIKAWKEVKVKETDNKTEHLNNHLNQSFAERRHVIDGMFARMDRGIEDNNPELIAQAMQAIEGTVRTSPLQQAEDVLAALNDSSVKKIEF